MKIDLNKVGPLIDDLAIYCVGSADHNDFVAAIERAIEAFEQKPAIGLSSLVSRQPVECPTTFSSFVDDKSWYIPTTQRDYEFFCEGASSTKREASNLTDIQRQEIEAEISHLMVTAMAPTSLAMRVAPNLLNALLERYDIRRRG